MTCTKCGKNLPDTAAFCPYCGNQHISAAAPQNEEMPPVYQPEIPVAEMQPQYAAPAEYEAPAQQYEPSQPAAPVHYEAPAAPAAKPEKKKKSAAGVVLAVVAVILVVALAGLNVVQYIKAGETKAELADANETVVQLEDSVARLEEDKAALDSELSALKADYDSAFGQLTELEETVADQDDQIAALENENSILAGQVTELDAQVAASSINNESLYTVVEFLGSEFADGYYRYDHFYTDGNLIFLQVGESLTFNVTYTETTEGAYFNYAWVESNVDVQTGDWDGDLCPVTVTGVGAGWSTIEFTNSIDDSCFEVLVVVVE